MVFLMVCGNGDASLGFSFICSRRSADQYSMNYLTGQQTAVIIVVVVVICIAIAGYSYYQNGFSFWVYAPILEAVNTSVFLTALYYL